MLSNTPTLTTEYDQMVCTVPLALKKRGGRKTAIVAPNGAEAPGAGVCNTVLVTAIARAFRWKRLLDEGKFVTICELAHATKQDSSYVMRIFRLTLLAPDIIEAILAGQEPSGLSLERLTKGAQRAWEAQRRVLGCIM
jgi:hypothetical protein